MRSLVGRRLMPALFVVFEAMLAGALIAPAATDAAIPLPAIAANDNRVAAGSVSGRSVRVALDARMGSWYPDGPGTLGIPIAAFGEPGKPLQFPGPLLRVRAGTTVKLTLRNALPGRTLWIHGLDVRADGDHPIDLPSGAVTTIAIRRAQPGTYGYWASDARDSLRSRFDADAALTGAFVVDDAHTAPAHDRVFVIGDWDHVWDAHGQPDFGGELLTINGRAWPATERLRYVRGETVRWRVYNASVESHPMHLHGFPFTVDAVGDGVRAMRVPAPAYDEVTHRVAPGETFDAHWVAARAGAWMFHCHIAPHTLPHAPLAALVAGQTGGGSLESRVHRTHDMMGGMMMAVVIVPKPGDAQAALPDARQRLALDVVQLPTPAQQRLPFEHFGYRVRDENGDVPASGTLGPTIVLHAGTPVAIAVTNHLAEATTVHWHGMPVESSVNDGAMFMDAGMSMDAAASATPGAAPPIRPGETFVARFTPPAAGTFMYHTHMDDSWQLVGGLCGPLVVLPPGAPFDPATDHVVMITTPADQPFGDAVMINGFRAPAPIVVHAGVPQRFRLINLTMLNSDLVVSLDGDRPLQWTPIAKDGMDLDARLRIPRRAVQQLTIGETRDFTFVADRPGIVRLQMFDGGPIGSTEIHVVE